VCGHAWFGYDTRSASHFGLLPGGIGDHAGDQRGEMGSLTQKQIQYIMVLTDKNGLEGVTTLGNIISDFPDVTFTLDSVVG
jgi:hypothetical protein